MEFPIKDKSACSACFACKVSCPKGAIDERSDSRGFLYPFIDPEKCVDCGICTKVCPAEGEAEKREPLSVYAARSIVTDIKRSASGGVFAALAKFTLEQGGSVFGAAMERGESGFEIYHKEVTDIQQLYGICSSKYVQSSASECYGTVKKCLEEGRRVLFSGTPCQIAALYSFLKGREYENLLTADLVCHGIPSPALFNSYISFLEKRYKAEVTGFTFRDKSLGGGHNGSLILKYPSGREKRITVYSAESSYYHYFLSGASFRDSCYACRYACPERVGDVTLGDYWGFDSEHPELAGRGFDSFEGVSCLMVNTEKGKRAVESALSLLHTSSTDYERVRAHNGQLNNPSKPSPGREALWREYEKAGYEGVERMFSKSRGKKYLLVKIYNRLPFSLKKGIKRALKG